MEAWRGFLPRVSILPRRREWGTAALADCGSVWIWFDNKAPSVCSQAPYVTRVGAGEVQKEVEMETRRHQEGTWDREKLVRPLRGRLKGKRVGFDTIVHFLPPEVGRG